ncbi:Uncharacterized protein M6B38_224875 [Iris pallida]|uniref:Uncharacterized protein n=1 Tax=Iris pallida TaxID=29817 RepID=A0AAX6DUA0_IRIPA|nr:Uncharacterized protein M6B38_224875 [Iris pallida]
MERSTRVRRSRSFSCRPRLTPYSLHSYHLDNAGEGNPNRKRTLALEKRDWEDAKCSVCMEFPHNAVLLLCSSHDKGCRPYMCGTSYRHSNCLDQFNKAYAKVDELEPLMEEDTTSLGLLSGGFRSVGWPLSSGDKQEVMDLASCPLCRGQVKGWTVVEPARKYLNNKKRSCMQDNCSFVGTYRELRKHVRSSHPCAKPREVDPTLEQKWRRLEHERERQDVISTIRSSMPRSVVFGDYVIDMANSDLDDSEEEDEDIGGGDGEDGEFEGGNRDIGRSILYFFLREGARFMRLHREAHDATPANLEGRNDDDDDDVGGSYDIQSMATDGDGGVSAPAYFSGDDDYIEDPVRGAGVVTSERRRRRRRRSRSRSVTGLS